LAYLARRGPPLKGQVCGWAKIIKAGLYVRLDLVLASLGLIVLLLLVKIAAKFIGVWPLTRAFKFSVREANYTTLLMATGLTFGTISALYGLDNKIIDQGQYTVLVTVVILSAVVPILIAQAFFLPRSVGDRAGQGVVGEEDLAVPPAARPVEPAGSAV